VFNYPNGFSGASGQINTAASATIQGSALYVTNSSNTHQSGGAWYVQQQDIRSFTTDFTFQMAPGVFGFTFCIQNSNSTTNYSPYGMNYGIYAYADANGLGYAAYANQPKTAIANSIAIKFDTTSDNGANYVGATPSSTGLYINGGPAMLGGFIPENDLLPAGINLGSGHPFAAHIVYDGNLLTMVLKDTSTGAQARMSWPVDIPAAIGSSAAWIGFTGGTVTPGITQINTWDFYEGYASQLASPTFSVTPGQYASAQTVSLNGPAGATLYYTTNGKAPTTSSAKYSGPISVSSTEIVQAIAVESGYTDSAVAVGNYQIAAAQTPLINLPNGFSGSAQNLIIPVGTAQFNGSNLQLTTTSAGQQQQLGAAWYAVPVNVQSFTTTFTLQMTPSINATNGMTFVIQNQNPASTDSSNLYVGGGPYALGSGAAGFGYQGLLNSVAIKFDPWAGSTNGNLSATGLYLNGATPDTANLSMIPSGLSLWSGNPYSVTMTYNGTTLSMTITDTVTHATYSTSWNVDIPATVGGNTAYIGFTAGMGYVSAGYNVQSWTYKN